jgi:hypothetical protein
MLQESWEDELSKKMKRVTSSQTKKHTKQKKTSQTKNQSRI